jgi:outer membrane protein OmpA-like peptidoglycan-associated protein
MRERSAASSQHSRSRRLLLTLGMHLACLPLAVEALADACAERRLTQKEGIMKLVQISGPAVAALLLAACGANQKHLAAQRAAEHAEEEKQEAQEDAREAREDTDKARREAQDAARAQRVAEQNAQWASQRAAQAELEVAREARPQPRMGMTERQADNAASNAMIKSSVQFAPNSADLSADAKAKLDDVARQAQGRNVIVQGFTDNTGPETANVQLSQRRAEEVADYLEHKGIPRERIATRGLGSSDPTSTQDTDRGRALNRRVEIVIQPAAK